MANRFSMHILQVNDDKPGAISVLAKTMKAKEAT